MSKRHCNAHHDEEMCLLPKCKIHNVLIGDIKELLQILEAFGSQLPTRGLSIHVSIFESVAKLLSRVNGPLMMCRRQFIVTKQEKEWTEYQHGEKMTQKYKKH